MLRIKNFFKRIIAVFNTSIWTVIIFALSVWLVYQIVHSRLVGIALPKERLIAMILAQLYLLYILVSRARRDGWMAFVVQAVLLTGCAAAYWFGSGGQALHEKLMVYEAYCQSPEPAQISGEDGIFVFNVSTLQVVRPGILSKSFVKRLDNASLVACVEQENQLLETCWYGDKRFQVKSTVQLIDRQTAEIVGTKRLEGKPPAKCRSTLTSRNYVESDLIGKAPTAREIGEILKEFIE